MKQFLNYWVTPDGELYHILTGEKKYCWLNKGRAGYYLRTQFWIDGKKKNIYVHRLMAMLYLPDWDASLEVDHLDGDTLNNAVDNLGMKSTTDNQLSHQDRKDGVVVRKIQRGTNVIHKEGIQRGYFPNLNSDERMIAS